MNTQSTISITRMSPETTIRPELIATSPIDKQVTMTQPDTNSPTTLEKAMLTLLVPIVSFLAWYGFFDMLQHM